MELVYPFGTKSERMDVLSSLGRGVLPTEFRDHGMAEGISKMTCAERDERWGCEDVREWLMGLKDTEQKA